MQLDEVTTHQSDNEWADEHGDSQLTGPGLFPSIAAPSRWCYLLCVIHFGPGTTSAHEGTAGADPVSNG